MSLTDKVIKNTIYFILAQVFGFIFPLILTPFIIGKIGEIQFGIYALVLGFTGTFGLFDLSVSNSFIKFISEHYNKKEFNSLNSVINTGLFFYVLFSLLCCITGFIFTIPLLSLLNIPENLFGEAVYAFRLSLVIFFITTSFGIFNSILVSLQKMYLTSIFGTIISILNFVSIIVLLLNGFGLKGLLYSQAIATSLSILMNFIIAKKYLPEMRISLSCISKSALKKMTNFGAQMQVSKLASFASDKYDEFLLGFFSVLNNVTYYNIGGRISRIGRFLPYQLVPQVAPVAAELNAKGENEKLRRLFADTTKYLTVISAPVFIFTFMFSDLIIMLWMGPGFELSSYILRILVLGQLVNMIFSAPGNSITPNIGIPKYQMYEGIINLGMNLVLSYIFIKYYGIIGAAIGNTISVIVSSLYVYHASSKYFNEDIFSLLKEKYLRPFTAAVVCSLFLFIICYALSRFLYPAGDRVSAFIYLFPAGALFLAGYSLWIFNNSYITPRDKEVLIKILLRVLPLKYFIERRNRRLYKSGFTGGSYQNELVSIFIITHNRLDFLKKCVNSLLPTLTAINYELIIWDNNSEDGTKEYLRSIENSRIKIILNEENIGTNAKGEAAELCRGEFIIGIDDDVISFPENWAEKLIYAYKNIPGIGYLATDVVQDEYTNGAKPPLEQYFIKKFNNDVELMVGPAGGWCFIISKSVYNKVGRFASPKGRIFYGEDDNYTRRIFNAGLKFGILKDLKVYHATGDYYNQPYKDIFDKKMEDLLKSPPQKTGLVQKIKSLLNIKYYYNKILEYAEREISKN